MNPKDRHYTPSWLADRLAELVPPAATHVVDLSAGGGALLEAVERRVPEVRLAAADIDADAVSALRMKHPGWVISRTNSLNPASYRSSAAFRRQLRGYDAAVLNPPFSYRGGARMVVRHADRNFRVAPATGFIAHALSWVRSTGVVVAIVPTNAMNVRGDRELWQEWRREFVVETVLKLDRNTFPGARTTTMLVRLDLAAPAISVLEDQRSGRSTNPRIWTGSTCTCVDIVRGRVPVHRAIGMQQPTGAPFVHSTQLRQGSLRPSNHRLPAALSTGGPLVLLPRVGTPNVNKVAVAELGSLVLSDCVLGLRPVDPRALRTLADLVTSRFDALAEQYIGSCARYVTVERLTAWLSSYGLTVRHVGAAEVSTCTCSESSSGAIG